jgi:Zn-dependent protease
MSDPYSFEEPERDYEPVQPRGFDWRHWLRMIWAPIAVVLGLVIKFGAFTLKFFGIFISVAAYALIWGWSFGVGFVLLILVHELGHFVEARRQGLHPSLPVFVPFLGAYVAIKDSPFDPWRNLLVAAAGPIAGGIAALAVYVAGLQQDSGLLQALGYTGFFLNLFNLIPIRPFDGGIIWQSLQVLRRGGGAPTPAAARARALAGGALYVAMIAALAFGMVAAHVPQDRL